MGFTCNKKWRVQKITQIHGLEKEGCRVGDGEKRERARTEEW